MKWKEKYSSRISSDFTSNVHEILCVTDFEEAKSCELPENCCTQHKVLHIKHFDLEQLFVVLHHSSHSGTVMQLLRYIFSYIYLFIK
jgi:hypothetical protein